MKTTKLYDEDGITVYHGDFSCVWRQVGSEINAVITDPPYLGARGQSWNGPKAPLKVPYDPATPDLLRRLAEVARSMVSNGWFVCFQDFPGCLSLRSLFSSPWKMLHAPIPWLKPPGAFVPAGSGNTIPKSVDFITAARVGQAVNRQRRGYYASESYSPQSEIYVTGGKPVQLMVELLEDFTEHGDTVFDPFIGGGTTLLAAMLSGRGAVGCDIDLRACELTIERLTRAKDKSSASLFTNNRGKICNATRTGRD